MFRNKSLKFFCCPYCKGDLLLTRSGLNCSSCGQEFPLVDSFPILLPSSMNQDLKLSQKKWDEEYQKTIKSGKHRQMKKGFEKTYLNSTLRYLKEVFPSFKDKVYLEIGCGPFLWVRN